MDLLTIGQWAGTIVALIAAIPGICAFMSRHIRKPPSRAGSF